MKNISIQEDSNMQKRNIELLNEIKLLLTNKVENKWMSIKDVTSYASISESTVRRAVKNGSLKASNATGKLLFKLSEVDNWLED